MPFSKRRPYRGISRRPLGTCRATLSFARRPPAVRPRLASRDQARRLSLMARRDSVGIRLLTRNSHDWSRRYPLIVEGFDDTLAGYRRAARHGRHATLDSVPARRLRRCRGRSRAFVSGRGVCVRLDVAEAGSALRANGSLENISHNAARGRELFSAAARRALNSLSGVSARQCQPTLPIV
jgi:hypothetical protein